MESQVVKSVDKVVVALFLATIGLVFPLDRWLRWRGYELPGRPHTAYVVGEPTLADWREGRARAKLRRRWLNGSYVGRWLTPRYNELVYRLTRRNTPASRIGRDGWVFVPSRTREFAPARWRELEQRGVRAVTLVREVLRRRGADLVVMLVPDRARIYPDKAYRTGRMPPGRRAFLPNVVADLRQQGVNVVDVSGALAAARRAGLQPFYSDDQHWTSRAAMAAAEALVSDLPSELRGIVAASEPAPRYRVLWDERAASEASLTRLIGFVPGGELEGRFRTYQPRASFVGVDVAGWEASCATYWSTSLGLWGSPEFFANAIRCPLRLRVGPGRKHVRNVVSDLEELDELGTFERRYLIIWELPEYHLAFGIGGSHHTVRTLLEFFSKSPDRSPSRDDPATLTPQPGGPLP